MPTELSDGVHIYYEVDGRGPPLVLVPGFATSLQGWKSYGYVDALRSDHQLILIDPRGHGKSGKPHDSSSYATQHRIRDVLVVLDALGIKSAHFLGYSYGGRIGFQLAKFAPERIKSAIILSASARGRVFDSANPIRQHLEEGTEAVLGRIGQYAQLPTEMKAVFLANDIEALIEANKAEMPDLEDDLSNMTMPFLILVGENDRSHPCTELQRVFKRLPDVTFVTLPGLDHTQAWYRSDIVLPHVRQFLLRVTSHERRAP